MSCSYSRPLHGMHTIHGGGRSFYTGGHITSPMRPLKKGFLSKADPHRHRIARYVDWPREDARSFVELGYDDWCMAAGWANWEMLFARWLEHEGLEVGFATSYDLDGQPNLLDGWGAYLSVGHDEYWSAQMRDQVEGYVDAGGNAAFFSGNTAFWQVRFEDDYRRMIGYKCDIELDPVYNPSGSPSLSTMWSDPLVNRPESEMTGVSFIHGGYARMPNAPMGSGGYTVWQPDHWAFSAVAMASGETLGAQHNVVGYECDGCLLEDIDGRPVAQHPSSPEGFQVLGTAPAKLWETDQAPDNLADNFIGELNWLATRFHGADTAENRQRFANGHAVMGTFQRGKGEVFTSGCTDWAYGLEDPQVAQVTRNVLQRFTANER